MPKPFETAHLNGNIYPEMPDNVRAAGGFTHRVGRRWGKGGSARSFRVMRAAAAIQYLEWASTQTQVSEARRCVRIRVWHEHAVGVVSLPQHMCRR